MVHLPRSRSVQEELSRIISRANFNPEQTLDELKSLRADVDVTLATSDPKQNYGRCVPVYSFWRNCLSSNTRSKRVSAYDYGEMLNNASVPGQIAFGDMIAEATHVLYPSANSWIAPLHRLLPLTGTELQAELQLPATHPPPYLLLRLPRDKLLLHGCKIRRPIGLDAAATKNTQWTPGGVLGERIDGPLCRGVVGGVEWKP